MNVGDQIGSSVHNPGKGTKTGQDSDSEIQEEVTNVRGYRRNSTGLGVGIAEE